MNREEEIERFRNEKLPEYIKLAEEDPYVVEIEKKIQPIECRVCSVCGEVKPLTAFYNRGNICRMCKNKKSLSNYYKKRIKLYKSKIENCKAKIKECKT